MHKEPVNVCVLMSQQVWQFQHDKYVSVGNLTLVLQGSNWVKNRWDPYNTMVTNYMRNNVCYDEEGIKGKAVYIGSQIHVKRSDRYYLLFLQFIFYSYSFANPE